MSAPIPLEQRVLAIVATVLGAVPQDVTSTKTLNEELGAHSLDRIELAMAVEREVGFNTQAI